MNAPKTFRLVMDPVTGVIATPDIQRQAKCDAGVAWRFPLGAMIATVTSGMGIFTLSDDQVDELVRNAREKTGSAAVSLLALRA